MNVIEAAAMQRSVVQYKNWVKSRLPSFKLLSAPTQPLDAERLARQSLELKRISGR